MSNKYVISGHHFGHTKIIQYGNRTFKDTNEMNAYLTKQWNKVVKKDDIVFYLGDFCFGTNDVIRYWFDQLKGRKILIMGNHDKHINHHPKFWSNIGFEEVYRYPIIYRPGVVLSHEPVLNYIRNCINIHGHTHTNKPNILYPEYNRYINVSVEEVDYKPINLDKLIENRGK